MQCEAFEQRLNRLLDRRRRPDADGALIAHAQRCGNCRRLLDGQRLLLDSLETFEPPSSSPAFSVGVVRRHLSERSRRRSRRTLRMFGSLAAVVMVAIFAASWRARRLGEDSGRFFPRASAERVALETALASAPSAQSAKRRTARRGPRVARTGVPAVAGHAASADRPHSPAAAPRDSAPRVDPTRVSVDPPGLALPIESSGHGAPAGDRSIADADADLLLAADAALQSIVGQPWLEALQSRPGEHLPAQDEQQRGLVMLDSWATQWAEMPAEPLEVDQIAGGLEPLTQPFGVAIDLLRQALPSGKTHVKKPQAKVGPRLSGNRLG